MLRIAVAVLPLLARTGTMLAEESADVLARALLAKAGIQATVCEMPRAGDGALAAALAKAGVAQVHALAPDNKVAEAARKPCAAAGVLGSQVIIETGQADALPLGDWVADLYVVADATDANLKTLSAAEAGRVLSPYRGVAVVGNPVKGAVSKASLAEWAKGTGGTATVTENASGLWAIVRMPPLKGGDDWSHFYHGPDGNPVSKDTAFAGKSYQMQWHDLPIQGDRNYTLVASAGRLFVATCSVYWGTVHTWWRPQHPYEIEARGLYNAKILWRRPISSRFGDMGSLLVATPDRLYAKDGTGVLVLDAETGQELSRVEVTHEPQAVRWIALSDGVLLTLAGPKPFHELFDKPVREKGENELDYAKRQARAWEERDDGQELAAWDAATGKALWRCQQARIAPRKLALSAGRVFLYVNDRDALCLELKTGRELWKTPAPNPSPASKKIDLGQIAGDRRGEMLALSTPDRYVIFDASRQQRQVFDARDGRLLAELTKGHDYAQWASPSYPLIVGNTLLDRSVLQYDLQSLRPFDAYPRFKGPQQTAADSCGHTTAVESGLWVGGGVWDMHTGTQVMPGLAKSACGAGFFVADGTEVLYPTPCTCHFWRGMFVVRAAPERPMREGVRFENGDTPAPADAQPDPRDWPTYRADEQRRGSSVATIPSKAAIRWIYAPAQPSAGRACLPLPAFLENEKSVTQPIAVGARLWLGTQEGAVVCLDKATGAEAWRYWTAGAIKSSPTWALGRIYAGSADGCVYCLDAATGKLCWRYRVAPEERRLTVMGGLSSVWPVWSNVLMHEGVAYAAAGIRGQLDGSALCALDAQTGAVRWVRFLKNTGETDAKGALVHNAPSGGGQMAWYDGKLWWHGTEWGPAVVDPATGALKPVTDFERCRDYSECRGQDIGVLPGGWVALGGMPIVRGISDSQAAGGKIGVVFRSGPDGLPSQGTGSINLASVPRLLRFTDAEGFTRVNRQIPVWDEREILLPGDFTKSDKSPILCRGLAEALNAEVDAHPWTEETLKKARDWRPLFPFVRSFSPGVLPNDRRREVLPDTLAQAVTQRKFGLSGMMVLASNAVVITGAWDNTWPGTEWRNWRAIAVSRADRATLWEVRLPMEPAWSGMSVTRDGDVLIPLLDGRLVCIGGDAAERPLPAAAVADTQPGLMVRAYVSDAVPAGYRFWTPGDFAIMKPVQTRILPEARIAEAKADDQTVLAMEGFLEAPETGNYRFSGQCGPGGNATFTLYDPTRQFKEGEFYISQYGGNSEDVFLGKGKHPIAILVLQGSSGKSFGLQWARDGAKPVEIPAEALSHLR
jgi:outer membrane protein assembly factor BamB